tara:strand:+ start:362 stop:622 length:261 start_codon:yes stop_codon:yes gene_type:complete
MKTIYLVQTGTNDGHPTYKGGFSVQSTHKTINGAMIAAEKWNALPEHLMAVTRPAQTRLVGNGEIARWQCPFGKNITRVVAHALEL